jgi:hypothetical protein
VPNQIALRYRLAPATGLATIIGPVQLAAAIRTPALTTLPRQININAIKKTIEVGLLKKFW